MSLSDFYGGQLWARLSALGWESTADGFITVPDSDDRLAPWCIRGSTIYEVVVLPLEDIPLVLCSGKFASSSGRVFMGRVYLEVFVVLLYMRMEMGI